MYALIKAGDRESYVPWAGSLVTSCARWVEGRSHGSIHLKRRDYNKLGWSILKQGLFRALLRRELKL